jgi:hypothetical protein
LQSVWSLATGWTAEVSEFESRYRQYYSPLHVVNDQFWVPPSLLLNDYLGLFPGGKAAGARSLIRGILLEAEENAEDHKRFREGGWFLS